MTKNIASLNYQRMKELGFKSIIFDKDQTLTLPGKIVFKEYEIQKSFDEAINVFGKENTILLA